MNRRNVAFLGLMSALAALLQISAAYFPGIGHLLSTLSTLPMIIAGRCGWRQGILAYITTSMLIFIIQPAEILIFLLMTGLLGLSLGITIYKRFTLHFSIFLTALSLTIGMMIASIIFAIPILGGFTVNFSILKRLIIYLIFSLAYSTLWIYFYKKISKRL